MAEDTSEQAQALREKGNALYKKGKLVEAYNAYCEASQLTPTDSAPLSNLSAVCYEMGDYDRSIQYATKALDLTDDAETEKIQRLHTRTFKSYVHLLSLDITNGCEFVPENEQPLFREYFNAMNGIWVTYPDEADCRRQILDRLPRYRAKIQDIPEYYSVGHDTARSQFDGELLKEQPDTTAFMFCGVGDARHFFATFADLASNEHKSPKAEAKRYHFTLLDIKPTAIARDLIIFFLLEELSKENPESNVEILATIYYVFTGNVMPGYIYAKLQATIVNVIAAMENESQIPTWLFIPSRNKEAILKHLRGWQHDTSEKWKSSKLRAITVSHIVNTKMSRAQNPYYPPEACETETAPGCQKESWMYERMGILQPPEPLLNKHEPELQELLAKLNQQAKMSDINKLHVYLDSNWQSNVTLIDLEWEEKRDDQNEPDMGHYPFELDDRLYSESGLEKPKNAKCLYDYVAPFFTEVAKAFVQLKGRFAVEMICGEMADILERFRYDMLDHRKEPAVSERFGPSSFPRLYHRIHMSNIPDYVGGHLTTFLYAIPILDLPPSSSTITSTCLRNPPEFKSIKHFLNEYTLVNDFDNLARLFSVQISLDSPLFRCADPPLPLGPDYISWGRLNSEKKPLSFTNLVSRTKVEKWLYGLILKLGIPYQRPTKHFTLIEVPLNTTIFFRLLARLHSIGYPAHWLSGIITNIVQDEILTSARAPRSNPLSIDEANTVFPMKKICIRPFIVELSTQTTLWQRLLPFGIIAKNLPRLTNIYEYEVSLPPLQGSDFLVPHSAIVFYDNALGTRPSNLRPIILDDEKGDRTEKAKRIRETGVHMLTTFKWVAESRTATFWLREDAVKEMKERGKWECFLWRVDTWGAVTNGVGVEKLVKKRSWIDDNTSKE